jgi:hypothetical protein
MADLLEHGSLFIAWKLLVWSWNFLFENFYQFLAILALGGIANKLAHIETALYSINETLRNRRR